MKHKLEDLIVIGGGVAGTTAAKAALDEGLSVSIISKGHGSSTLSSGAIDVLGVIPTKEKNYRVKNICQGIECLLENSPKHPYAAIKGSINNGIKAFQEVCKVGGLHYYGDGVENKMVANTLGTFTGTAYLPYPSKDSDLTDFKGTVLVVGFRSYSEFYAEYTCKSFNEYKKQFTPNSKVQYIATTIELPSMADRTRISNAELGAKLDTKEGIKELGEELKRMISSRWDVDLILLPPVLGYLKYNENKDYLEDVTGVKVSEILTAGHSIPGQRLTDAMKVGAERLGISYNYRCTATGIALEDNIYTVKYTENKVEKQMKAKAIVLATGGFIGEGITAYREDLTAEVINEPLGRVSADMINKRVFAPGGHSFNKIGVKAYNDMRLAQGKLSGKIYVCGEIMEGYDWIYERSQGGVAVASGYLAGKNAAASVKRSEQ